MGSKVDIWPLLRLFLLTCDGITLQFTHVYHTQDYWIIVTYSIGTTAIWTLQRLSLVPSLLEKTLTEIKIWVNVVKSVIGQSCKMFQSFSLFICNVLLQFFQGVRDALLFSSLLSKQFPSLPPDSYFKVRKGCKRMLSFALFHLEDMQHRISKSRMQSKWSMLKFGSEWPSGKIEVHWNMMYIAVWGYQTLHLSLFLWDYIQLQVFCPLVTIDRVCYMDMNRKLMVGQG